MQRVLVIKHGAFGDIVQSDGALRDIRVNHPGAEIAILTTPAYRRLFERCPWVDRVLVDPRAPRWRLDKMLALRSRLCAEAFGQVYDLQNSTRTAAYRRWLLPRVPWSGTMRRRTLLLRAAPQTRPSLVRMADQLREAGLAVRFAEHPNVAWMADDVSGLLAEAGVPPRFVVLVPGSSARHPGKRWSGYPALAEALLARGFGVVTAPGPDERDLAAAVPGHTLRKAGGYLNWFELAGLFSCAAFVVGNDTGPTHLASHVGASGLALFGPHVAPAMTGIVGDSFGAITVDDLSVLRFERVLKEIEVRLDASAPMSGAKGAPKSTGRDNLS